jgi:hypothetical protein
MADLPDTPSALRGYLKTDWARIKTALLGDRYQPQAVRRVETPKPA